MRIRLSGGRLYFESRSRDNVFFQPHGSTLLPNAVDTVHVHLEAGSTSPNTPTPTTTTYSDA